jgi:ribose 5-phosphate isomerase B
MRVAIAGDHNGIALKAQIVDRLTRDGYVVEDLGAHGEGVVDYPELCVAVAGTVASGRAERGIVIGGSGQGEHIACNKIRGIRAGLCSTLFDAEISRGNNDANVLVLGAKVVPTWLALEIASTWLALPFKGGVHQRRVDQIMALEHSDAIHTNH